MPGGALCEGKKVAAPDAEKEERKREGETKKQTHVDTHRAERKMGREIERGHSQTSVLLRGSRRVPASPRSVLSSSLCRLRQAEIH